MRRSPPHAAPPDAGPAGRRRNRCAGGPAEQGGTQAGARAGSRTAAGAAGAGTARGARFNRNANRGGCRMQERRSASRAPAPQAECTQRCRRVKGGGVQGRDAWVWQARKAVVVECRSASRAQVALHLGGPPRLTPADGRARGARTQSVPLANRSSARSRGELGAARAALKRQRPRPRRPQCSPPRRAPCWGAKSRSKYHSGRGTGPAKELRCRSGALRWGRCSAAAPASSGSAVALSSASRSK